LVQPPHDRGRTAPRPRWCSRLLYCKPGITPGKFAEWRDEALGGMRAGILSREPRFLHDLKVKVGNWAAQIEPLEK
jgi:hypothetical protein